ncbi:TetR/AcrR family transcriptional regulator [Ligilactobacillus acidipiscis]|uniref:TetR/AcrR family transcriptional regulator n=1 Tax=Ligilactobacillus acidipiscis TaxID=89059 RepID=UPI0023F68B31|nr:TetR/AcrR family transcriptional regulator [Ligilactobacillus acidipiscis]WEV57444.1 TetR/AcrR family transcriptional regulator [Ligilactobacillus acidipiscis]
MNKQTQQTEKTKKALKEAFLVLYQQKDIDKITIKAISDGASVYRSTFYIHFTDIFDLLNQIEQEEVGKFKSYIQINFKEATIKQFMQLIISYFELNGNLLYLLVRKSKNDHFSTSIKQAIVKIIEDILGIKQKNNVKVDFALEYIADSFIFLLGFWHQNQAEIKIGELYPFAMQILHHGVLSELTPFATKSSDTIQQL